MTRKSKTSLLTKIYWCVFFSFMYIPIVVMMALSFNESKSRSVFTGFSLKWYEQLFQNEMILKSFATSIFIAIVSSIVVTILGTLAAVGICKMRKWQQSVVLNISYMPIINPEIIIGISLMLLFVVFKDTTNVNLFGIPTLLISHITFNLPIVIFSVIPKIKQMDTRLYEAGLDLGCNPTQAFYKIVLPEIMPGITSGFLMSLTYSIDDFVISHFTSGMVQTLPIQIYSMTRKKVSPEINALSTIVFVVILTVVIINGIISSKKEKKLSKAKNHMYD